MSSPVSSSPTLDRDALLAALPEVVVSVAENGFFAWAEACSFDRFGEAAELPGVPETWLRARVGFRGSVDGLLEVLLPDRLSRALGGTMIGAVDASAITDDESVDVAGELTNVLCGALLTRASRDARFDLAPPHVERWLSPGSTAALRADDRCFTINGCPVAVRLVVHGA